MSTRPARLHPRASFHGSVALCRRGESCTVRPTNISPGGVAVLTEEHLAARALVTLRLALPGERGGVTVLGRVVRSQPAGPAHAVAVEFLDMLPSVRARVAAFVAGALPALSRAG